MAAFMPVLVFLPVFVAIAFLIANVRRGPQPAPAAAQRRTKTYQLVVAAGCALSMAAIGLLVVHGR